ncbi:MAG: ATP-binding protein [Gemmatimonadota bacterium]
MKNGDGASGSAHERSVGAQETSGGTTLDLEPPRIAPPHGIRARGARPSIWIGGAATLLIFVSVMAPYRATVDEVHVVLPMLLLILLASSIGGERLGFFLAAVGFVAIDTIFQRPFGTFSMRKSHDLTVLVSFFVTAAVATRLLARAQFQAAEARRRSGEVQRMADLGADMLSAVSTTAALERVATVMCELLGAERCRISRGFEADKQEVVAESLVFRSSGGGHRNASSDPLRFPLFADGVMIGDMRVDGVDARVLRETRGTTLQAMAQYAALGLDRMQLAANAAHADSLREADRMKDMVLASVSHDLRTPLTTIKLLAASLSRRGEAAAVQIEEEADRLSRMVGDLLDMSRARAGELSLAMDVNTLEDLVGAAMRQLTPMLGDRRVTRLVADDEGPLVGRFDFVASLRVLVNVMENAAKYSGADSPIELVARRDGEELVIEVRDRGPGVADEDLGRIFIPFFRSKAVLYDVGGAGLGLPMAKLFAEAQGGQLLYTAREGGGSIFTFTLPALDEAFEPALDEPDTSAG